MDAWTRIVDDIIKILYVKYRLQCNMLIAQLFCAQRREPADCKAHSIYTWAGTAGSTCIHAVPVYTGKPAAVTRNDRPDGCKQRRRLPKDRERVGHSME